MSVKVTVSIGEDYPHLFVSDDPDEIAWAENPASRGLHAPPAVVELADAEWAAFTQARDRYYALVQEMSERYEAAGGRRRS